MDEYIETAFGLGFCGQFRNCCLIRYIEMNRADRPAACRMRFAHKACQFIVKNICCRHMCAIGSKCFAYCTANSPCGPGDQDSFFFEMNIHFTACLLWMVCVRGARSIRRHV
ncbi:hypothetical protein D3C81_1844590 [compost metagenome]